MIPRKKYAQVWANQKLKLLSICIEHSDRANELRFKDLYCYIKNRFLS